MMTAHRPKTVLVIVSEEVEGLNVLFMGVLSTGGEGGGAIDVPVVWSGYRKSRCLREAWGRRFLICLTLRAICRGDGIEESGVSHNPSATSLREAVILSWTLRDAALLDPALISQSHT